MDNNIVNKSALTIKQEYEGTNNYNNFEIKEEINDTNEYTPVFDNSNQISFQCKEEIDNNETMHTFEEYSNSLLNHTVKLHCEICDYNTDSNELFEHHMNSHVFLNTNDENIKVEDIKFEENHEDFIDEHCSLSSNLLQEQVFSGTNENEIMNDEKAIEKTNTTLNNKTSKKVYQCQICSYSTTNKSVFSRHYRLSHEIDPKCRYCHQIFDSSASLIDHMVQVHYEHFPVRSDTSENSYGFEKIQITVQSNEYSENEKSRTIVPKPPCDDDPLGEQKKEIRKSYKCNICSYKTTYNRCLTRHIKTVHNNHRLKRNCQICYKSYMSQKTLDDHLLKVHKEEIKLIESKVYACNNCSYKTTHKPCLNRHILIHDDHKLNTKLNCQICDQRFISKQSRDEHLAEQHKIVKA